MRKLNTHLPTRAFEGAVMWLCMLVKVLVMAVIPIALFVHTVAVQDATGV